MDRTCKGIICAIAAGLLLVACGSASDDLPLRSEGGTSDNFSAEADELEIDRVVPGQQDFLIISEESNQGEGQVAKFVTVVSANTGDALRGPEALAEASSDFVTASAPLADGRWVIVFQQCGDLPDTCQLVPWVVSSSEGTKPVRLEDLPIAPSAAVHLVASDPPGSEVMVLSDDSGDRRADLLDINSGDLEPLPYDPPNYDLAEVKKAALDLDAAPRSVPETVACFTDSVIWIADTSEFAPVSAQTKRVHRIVREDEKGQSATRVVEDIPVQAGVLHCDNRSLRVVTYVDDVTAGVTDFDPDLRSESRRVQSDASVQDIADSATLFDGGMVMLSLAAAEPDRAEDIGTRPLKLDLYRPSVSSPTTLLADLPPASLLHVNRDETQVMVIDTAVSWSTIDLP